MREHKRLILIVSLLVVSVWLGADSCLASQYHGGRRRNKFDRGEGSSTGRTVTRKPAVPVPAALPAPTGPKKLVAVAEFDNKTNWAGQVNLGVGMADQLITSLMNTGRFIVLERQSIEAVLREQDFASSGRTTGEGGSKVGKINRAQILIQGAITEFEQSASSGGGAVAVQGFTFSGSEAKAHVAVDVRIYDTTTGQILSSKACKGIAKSSGGSFGYSGSDFGFAAGGEARTPLDLAVRDAINQTVYFIIQELDRLPWEGRVAVVKENFIYINCGRTAGIKIGDNFSIWKPGEPIIDPETGLNLGSENKKFGSIEVISVDEKFSKAVPMTGTGFERNDIVKYKGRKVMVQPAAGPVEIL